MYQVVVNGRKGKKNVEGEPKKDKMGSDIQFELIKLDIIGAFLIEWIFYTSLKVVKCDQQKWPYGCGNKNTPMWHLISQLLHYHW